MTWTCHLVGGPDDGRQFRLPKPNPVLETAEFERVPYLAIDDPEAADPFDVPNVTRHRYDLVRRDDRHRQALYHYHPPKDQP